MTHHQCVAPSVRSRAMVSSCLLGGKEQKEEPCKCKSSNSPLTSTMSYVFFKKCSFLLGQLLYCSFHCIMCNYPSTSAHTQRAEILVDKGLLRKNRTCFPVNALDSLYKWVNFHVSYLELVWKSLSHSVSCVAKTQKSSPRFWCSHPLWHKKSPVLLCHAFAVF